MVESWCVDAGAKGIFALARIRLSPAQNCPAVKRVRPIHPLEATNKYQIRICSHRVYATNFSLPRTQTVKAAWGGLDDPSISL
jgi:hypothetical protein